MLGRGQKVSEPLAFSRGAAIEISPGRKPGERHRMQCKSPVGAKESFAPTGLVRFHGAAPRLAPWANFCRRSAAYDFLDAKSFMNCASDWQPSTGIAL